MTDSRPIHITMKGPVLFLSMAELYSIVYMFHIFFTHSSVNGHLVSFFVLADVNSAVVNTLAT